MTDSDRRFAVPFDPEFFARRAAAGEPATPAEVFREAFQTNHWRADSRSGGGADLIQTARIRAELPDLLRRWNVGTMLDLPCGDGRWMATIPLPRDLLYLGADLLPDLVTDCQAALGAPGRRYLVRDLLESKLPQADLLFSRDCLVHLSYQHIRRAIRSIKEARITLLLTTTFSNQTTNVDITTGDWRPINLELPPFSFPAPLELLNEGCTEQDGLFADKSLALWRVQDLPLPRHESHAPL